MNYFEHIIEYYYDWWKEVWRSTIEQCKPLRIRKYRNPPQSWKLLRQHQFKRLPQ